VSVFQCRRARLHNSLTQPSVSPRRSHVRRTYLAHLFGLPATYRAGCSLHAFLPDYRRIFNVSYAARTKSGRDRAPFSQWRRRALKLRTFTIVVELEVSKIALQLVVIHFTVQLLLR
jgi:hypothetical protein